MTAHEKVMSLIRQAEEIMSDAYEMQVNDGKVLFALDGTKNMQTRMHKELNKWWDLRLDNKQATLVNYEIYKALFYSINAMKIE